MIKRPQERVSIIAEKIGNNAERYQLGILRERRCPRILDQEPQQAKRTCFVTNE